jgi:hypothetical protein
MHLVKRTLLPIAAGLILAQCIATGFVHLSNLDVHDMVIEARQSGFFAIPHGRAAATLTTWGAAFWGGLFYTLSIGVGLTLMTWAFGSLWFRVGQRKLCLIVVLNLICAGLVVFIVWPSLLDGIATIWPKLSDAIDNKTPAVFTTFTRLAIGFIFTIAIGILLTIPSWMLSHPSAPARLRKRRWIIVLFSQLFCLAVAMNVDGVALFPTLFCLLIPIGTLAALYPFKPVSTDPDRHSWIIPAFALGLLTAIWVTQLSPNLFITIRDHLLLSNPVGRSVNDFYYRYTLFAAQSFKSVYQKTLRTCHLSGDIDHRIADMVKTRLLGSDVLPLPDLRNPDMRVSVTRSSIVLTDRHGRKVERDLKQFLKAPHDLLRSFSAAADRYGPLRRMTLFGLMFGFPILLFIVVYTAFRIALGLLLHHGFGWSNRNTTFASATLCLMIGIGLFLPMQASVTPPLSAGNLAQALAADTWQLRVAALRHAEINGLDLADYPQYRALVHSPLPVERYWLARALAAGRNPVTYTDLLSLVADRHPNVQCQVYYALGKRGNRSAIQTIKAQILASDHWYTQWYGYRAIRRLGWHQGRSKE